ncbi:SDR family oxidoreductase [Streptomyces muensis]|uniref:SDR family oxidoreductase n=1 Tax=Streptomyces muensis TaxID=1077944 RepID=A0A9X1PW03_STRM4|nr:SDR family oxidoreductase [Streptomyces muensis]MCF1592281.1 SDR family oxidoreductase [Streptomyces muensis]
MTTSEAVEAVDVVVGAGSGMGAASAAALKGSRRLLLVDRDEEAVQRVADEVGGEAVVCDLTDSAAIDELSARIGKLGSMIVTAGVSGAPGEVTIAINLVGVARLLHAVEPAVGEGTAVVLFASMTDLMQLSPEIVSVLDEPLHPDLIARLRAAGADPSDPGQGYVLSKTGIVRLVRNNAFDWWHRGARIVSVSPGVIDTPMLAQTSHLPVVQQMKKTVRRFGRPEEVGQVAAFLASDKASYVTGVNLNVDAGYVTATQERTALRELYEDSSDASVEQLDRGA